MRKIVVLGDANIDFTINLIRVPNKGEKVPAGTLAADLGGQAVNQVVAAKRLGANAELFSKVGYDVFAGLLEGLLKKERINLNGLFRGKNMQSGMVVGFVGKNGEAIVSAVKGAYFDLTEEEVDRIKLDGSEIAIAQMLLPIKAVLRFVRRAKRKGCTVMLNCSPPKRIGRELMGIPDYLIMNEHEFAFHTGCKVADCKDIKKLIMYSGKIRRKGQAIIVTLGSAGLFVANDSIHKKIKGHNVKVVNSIGAGDCFLGAFAACISRGEGLEHSLRFANAAAAISVQRPGISSAMPYAHEVRRMMKKAGQ